MQKKASLDKLSRRRAALGDALKELETTLEVAFERSALVKGNVYELARKCGKPTCVCAEGQLHRSMVLSWSHQARLALMTPTENHAAMQLPFGANASRLAAFTGKLIDIAFHQSGTLESHLERRLQFLQGIAQGGPPAAELVEGCFLLHATTIYRIQIRAPQSEKSTPLSKMFSDDQARFALAGFRKELIAVSESQIRIASTSKVQIK